MKQLTATIIILLITLTCNAQKYWEDSAYQQRVRKMSAERDIALAKQNAYWDSINNKSRNEFRAEIIKKYGKVKGTKIANGEIELGYTQQMVTDAWGPADRITTTVTNGVTLQNWYYKNHKAMLTFKKNKIVSITG